MILEHNVPLYGMFIWSSRIVDPGLMMSLMTSSRNNHCRNFGAKYLENDARQRDGYIGEPIETCLWLSIAYAPDDVTLPDDVIVVTSWFFCKMLLLRQHLSELGGTLYILNALHHQLARLFNSFAEFLVSFNRCTTPITAQSHREQTMSPTGLYKWQSPLNVCQNLVIDRATSKLHAEK